MTTRAAEMMLQCVFDGTISMHDMEIKGRPYHGNCGCALHTFKDVYSSSCSQKRTISFPKKQPWKDCSFSAKVPKSASQTSVHSDSSVRNRIDTNGALSQR